MKIAALSWRGVAGLADAGVELFSGGQPSDLVVVSGPSGSGKSRLLWSIVAAKERLAPYGAGPSDESVTGGTGSAKIAVDWWFSEKERADVGLDGAHHHTEVMFPSPKMPSVQAAAVNELLSRYSHSKRIGKIDYVPPDRTMPVSASASGDSEFDQKRRRLARGSEKYAASRRLAVDIVRRGGSRADELGQLFSALCPHLRIGGVTPTNDVELVRASGRSVLASKSASSEWEAFVLATTVVVVGLHESVILYDTPELHLDGAEAARRIGVLRTMLPTTQLIVASKSEAVVGMQGAHPIRLGGIS